MAKKKAEAKESKSDFLRKFLAKDCNLDHGQINRKWTKAGHPGQISTALFYQVRSKMGIKTVWQWVQMPQPEAKAATSPAPGSGSVKPTSKAAGPAYQLKVTLRDVRPPVWRRLIVPDCTLAKLHEYLQVAMGWQNYHLYSFDVGPVSYTDGRGAGDLDMEDASRVRLSQVLAQEKAKCRYTYDFGDNWEHDVLVEKVLPPEEGRKLAECLEGKRSCPPEDVGGSWGYVDFLEAIADPKNDQHEEMIEWSGGDFDPERFDLDGVNKVLRRLK